MYKKMHRDKSRDIKNFIKYHNKNWIYIEKCIEINIETLSKWIKFNFYRLVLRSLSKDYRIASIVFCYNVLFCYYTLVSRSISNDYRIFNDFPGFVQVFRISIHITIFWVYNYIFFYLRKKKTQIKPF